MKIAMPIFLVVILLAVQPSWSAGNAILPCGTAVEEPLQLQETVAYLETPAMEAYFHKSPEDAVQALSRFVQCLAYAGQKRTLPAEFRSALHYDEMVARGRLARTLRLANNPRDADVQEKNALALSRDGHMRVKSSDELAALVRELDQKATMRR